MTVTERIVKALGALEDLGTPAAIAATLRIYGIKGRIQGPTTCPIQRYLAAKLDGDEFVGGPFVNGWTVSWMDATMGLHTTSVPYVVRRFIRAFDDRHYPDLIEPGEGY